MSRCFVAGLTMPLCTGAGAGALALADALGGAAVAIVAASLLAAFAAGATDDATPLAIVGVAGTEAGSRFPNSESTPSITATPVSIANAAVIATVARDRVFLAREDGTADAGSGRASRIFPAAGEGETTVAGTPDGFAGSSPDPAMRVAVPTERGKTGSLFGGAGNSTPGDISVSAGPASSGTLTFSSGAIS